MRLAEWLRALAIGIALSLAPPALAADPQPTPSAAASTAGPAPVATTPAPTPLATTSPLATPTLLATPSPEPSPAASDADGQVVDLTSRPAAYIEAKAKREEVYGAIMGSLAKIRAEVSKAGLKTEGHALAVFLEADDDGFTYRAMVPLDSAPPATTQTADPVKLGQTPVGKAMKFEHRGEYDDIDSTYDAITAYLDEKGVDAQDVFVEEYLNEPKTSDDPNLQADIYVLIR